jgi:urease accessory protein
MVPIALRCSGIAVLLLISGTALGHAEGHDAEGFLTGFLHPLSGWDHMLAMVAVGLWGAYLGRPALWQLPVTFPLVMALGGALGIAGIALPFVEAGIAASALVLGLMVTLAVRPPLGVAAALVGIFAIFHGHAHGTELPHATSALGYAAGFVMATGLLHLGGIAMGLLIRWPAGQIVVRSAGGLIAAGGFVFLLRLI